MLWLLACCLLVHDSPAEHPRISLAEKQYIEASTPVLTGEEKVSVITLGITIQCRKLVLPWVLTL